MRTVIPSCSSATPSQPALVCRNPTSEHAEACGAAVLEPLFAFITTLVLDGQISFVVGLLPASRGSGAVRRRGEVAVLHVCGHNASPASFGSVLAHQIPSVLKTFPAYLRRNFRVVGRDPVAGLKGATGADM